MFEEAANEGKTLKTFRTPDNQTPEEYRVGVERGFRHCAFSVWPPQSVPVCCDPQACPGVCVLRAKMGGAVSLRGCWQKPVLSSRNLSPSLRSRTSHKRPRRKWAGDPHLHLSKGKMEVQKDKRAGSQAG